MQWSEGDMVMMLSNNSLVRAWQHAEDIGAETFEDIPDELRSVTSSDIRETTDALEALPPEDVNANAAGLAAFCYAAAGALRKPGKRLVRRAAGVFQQLALIALRDPSSMCVNWEPSSMCVHWAPTLLRAVREFPLGDNCQLCRLSKLMADALHSGERLDWRILQLEAARRISVKRQRDWSLLAESLLDKAGDEMARDNYGLARDAAEEVLELCRCAKKTPEDEEVLLAARAHSALGIVERQQDQAGSARSHFEDAKKLLSELSAKSSQVSWAPQMSFRIHEHLSEIYEGEGQYSLAQSEIEQAMAVVLSREPAQASVPLPSSGVALLPRLVSIVRLGEGDSAAETMLGQILDEHGVQAAAFAGHKLAHEVMSVEWDSYDEIAEVLRRNSSVASAQERLVQLLNVNPRLIQLRVEELAEEATAERMAVELKWAEVTADAETEDEKTRAPIVPAHRHPGWQRWRAVQIMQRIAEVVVDVGQGQDDDRILVSDRGGRFRSFTIEDVDVLGSIARRRNPGPTIRFEAGVAGKDGGCLNYHFPDEDAYRGPLADEYQVDLMIHHTFTLPVWPRAPFDFWILDGIELLLDALIRGNPNLRRCDMPKGVMSELDYLLGERQDPPPRCGRYFIPSKRHADTCGNATCQTYHGQLQPREIKLMNRARELAVRDYGRLGTEQHFDELWRQAKAETNSPEGALAAFRQPPQAME